MPACARKEIIRQRVPRVRRVPRTTLGFGIQRRWRKHPNYMARVFSTPKALHSTAQGRGVAAHPGYGPNCHSRNNPNGVGQIRFSNAINDEQR